MHRVAFVLIERGGQQVWKELRSKETRAAMAKVAEADRTEEVFDFVGKTEEAALDAGRKFAKAVGEFALLRCRWSESW